MPDIENSRKTAEKGCRVGHGETARKQPKHTKNSRFGCFSGVSAVFPAVFRLSHRDPLGTHFFGCRAFGTSVAGRRDRNFRVLKGKWPFWGSEGQMANLASQPSESSSDKGFPKDPPVLNLLRIVNLLSP